jgi:sporulation protein YlmC with PRC-barrel domain
MRLSDLRDTMVRTLDGETLGRVHEVHCEGGRVTALICGAGSFIERLTAKKQGRRIPWECVKRIGRKEIIVTPDPPQRKPRAKKASASRSRQGTRQPSGRRSKR